MGRFEKIFITGNPNVQFQYSYDAASNETQRYNWANHIAQNYVPDSLNRMTSAEVKNTTTNTQLGLETYDYYPISRLHSVTREDNKQDSFTYYLDGELNVATYGANSTPPPTPSPTPTPTPTPTAGGQVAEPTFSPDGAFASACANTYTFNVIIGTATGGADPLYSRWKHPNVQLRHAHSRHARHGFVRSPDPSHNDGKGDRLQNRHDRFELFTARITISNATVARGQWLTPWTWRAPSPARPRWRRT